MRKLTAIVTPQGVINDCLHAVEWTVRTRGVPVLPNTRLDHFGFCVTSEQYLALRDEFAGRLVNPYQFCLPEGGTAMAGFQAVDSKLGWWYGNLLPSLALVTSNGLGLPGGGGYVVVVASDLASCARQLAEDGFSYVLGSLYGQSCLKVELETAYYGVGSGVYRIYILTTGLLGSIGRLIEGWFGRRCSFFALTGGHCCPHRGGALLWEAQYFGQKSERPAGQFSQRVFA